MNRSVLDWPTGVTVHKPEKCYNGYTVVNPFYDPGRDPYELTNVIDDPAYAETAEVGRQRLLKWMDDSDDPLRFGVRRMLGS